MFKQIKRLFGKTKKETESIQKVVYRNFKEKRDIEDIMKEFSLSKEEIITMIQDEKKIRRGE